MNMLPTREPGSPRFYAVLDIESAVTNRSGHNRYLAMERFDPAAHDGTPRRGYDPANDPLITPRWVFQTIHAVSLLVLVESAGGNLEVASMTTLSTAITDELGILKGLLSVLDNLPPGAELVTWGGAWHDLPIITAALLRYGLALPHRWRWMAWGGEGKQPHLDLSRALSAGSKMKPVHLAEYLAALDIPAKLSAPPFAVARLIEAGNFELVEEIVEGDVITLGLLLARWRCLFDDRANHAVVEDRILREVEAIRPRRAYVSALRHHRNLLTKRWIQEAMEASRAA